MKTFVRIGIVCVGIGSAAVAAAGGGTARAADTPPAAGEQEKTATSERGDIVQMVDEALTGVALRPDQTQAFQTLAADVDAKVTAVEQAKRDLLLRLADAIEAGKVDEASMASTMAEFDDAAAKASPVVRKAFEKLHDSLDAEQRKQFVANFHDALKKAATAADPKDNVDEMSSLKLTDDQKEKIGAIFAEDSPAIDVARDRARLVLDAFKQDAFSMDDLLPAASIKHRADRMIHRVVDVTGRVTELLTPEQRTRAANMIRDKVTGRSAGETGTGQTSAALESTATSSDALWAGRRTAFATRFRPGVGWGFRRGWGVGGFYLL
jgi:Spy/CpxP family protein refolding chaperone